MKRCVNIDWLEVYALENSALYPCNAEYFRARHYWVREREYGTRQYNEMFTILDDFGESLIEIRRNPVSGSDALRNKGIFDPNSCHIRLSNRSCYMSEPIRFLLDFLHLHQYTVKRLFRLDICYDFLRFDSGDDPYNFLHRYMAGKYSKINQANISANGRDMWDGRYWNSLSWGSPHSMVSTKFYNKTLELQQKKDKPYIRMAWQQAGLVDDFIHLTKLDPVSKELTIPTIWRIEYSIKSSAAFWYKLKKNTSQKADEPPVPHSLAAYDTRDKLLSVFQYLTMHYFHFKHYVPDVRKDRCPDKVLFKWESTDEVYILDKLLTERSTVTTNSVLEKKLREYRLLHPSSDICNACDILLRSITSETVRNSLSNPQDNVQDTLYRLIMSITKDAKNPLPNAPTLKKLREILEDPEIAPFEAPFMSVQ